MKKTLELCKVRPGETFTLDGVDFVKLADEQGAVFALTVDAVLKNVPFKSKDTDRESNNNYSGSSLSNAVYRWAVDGHKAIYDAIMLLKIDLTTMDGMTDYGRPNAVCRALTIDEYRKHRRFIPLTDEPYWLATGYTTNSSPYSDADYAYYVSAHGMPNFENVCSVRVSARPAFYLKSSVLVSVRDGEEEPVLADFSDTDLLDELCRRRHQT